MVPVDKLIDDKEATQIKKADARTARIDQRQKQYAITALKNADPCSVGTPDASFDINHSETAGIYGGDYDNEDDGNLSYHSSDGSDEEDFDADLSLGDGADGTSPTASTNNTAKQSPRRRQMNDLPDWLQEMIEIQAYGISHLLSAPITKCFPCFAYNNHANETDPRGWRRAFLRKSGAHAWEVFDEHFEEIGPDME